MIVFNNYRSEVFTLISGPSTLPELEQRFETLHSHFAKQVAEEFGFDYYCANNDQNL